MKNILALMGLVALVGAMGMWKPGFFGSVKEHVERETALKRAQMIVRDMEERDALLSSRARELRIDARTREKAVEREEQETSKRKRALAAMATAARDAGLPKPSAVMDDDLARTAAFAGRTLTAEEVYGTLEHWQMAVRVSQERLNVTRTMIDGIRMTADQLEKTQSQFVAKVHAMRATLERLEMQRDLAEFGAELAELSASASGNPAGELQGVLETLRRQIDEYEATSEVLAAESTSGDVLTPDEVLAGPAIEVTLRKELDTLWEEG